VTAARRIVAVAWSGGRDSSALLLATLRVAADCGIEVVALHVHHGLSPHADAWLAHCAAQCARWQRRGLPMRLRCERIVSRPGRGDSIEAWARRQRYDALRRLALEEGASIVLLGHHRRDQAETLLLQALRGAGVAGLAGMPREVERDGITWARPWLRTPREAIEAYVRRHRLRHVDDDSNDDPRYARNRLRREVWPALTAAFPHAEATLADSATRAHEAARVAADLAAVDLAAVGTDDGALALGRLAELAPHRRSNLLRHWLRAHLGQAPAATLLDRLAAELDPRGTQRWQLQGAELRSHRGKLATVPATVQGGSAHRREERLQLRRAGRVGLPGWGGTLVVRRVRSGGVPLAWLAQLELRPRTGGERFQAGIGRPPRGLKKQYQAAGIPQWQRDGPLLYSGGQLVFVPGLGIDARVVGLEGQALVQIEWRPAPPGAPG